MMKTLKNFLTPGKAFSFVMAVIIAITVYSCEKEPEPEPETVYYNVTLVFNNDQADSIVQVAEGAKMIEPADPVKPESEGGDTYQFDAWYASEDFSGDPFDFRTEIITEDITLYAKYVATFAVLFNSITADGTADSTFVKYVSEGETLPLLEIPIPRLDEENKFFTGWFDAETGGTEYTVSTPVTTSLELFYQMESTNYLIFDVDGVNRTLTIGGFIESSPDQITNITSFEPPANIGVFSVTKIGNNMFYPVDDGSTNTTLETVVLPEGVEVIGARVFRECKVLTSVSLPSTLKEIEPAVFWGTNALENLDLPEGITYLPNNFAVNSGLVSITLPSSLTEIRNGAFVQSKKLASISIPDNVTYIGWDAFGGNDALTTVSFNVETSKLDSISGGAFFDCINLTSITLPNSLRVIGGSGARNMFINCKKLVSVTIPANVEYIGGGAFALCDDLETAIFLGNTPPNIEDALFNKRAADDQDDTPVTKIIIKVPPEALSEYKAAAQEPYPYGPDWQYWDNGENGEIIANE
jgi:hypothetical protein